MDDDGCALTRNFVIPAAADVTILGMQIHSAYRYVKDAKICRATSSCPWSLEIASSLQINKSIIGSSLVDNPAANAAESYLKEQSPRLE